MTYGATPDRWALWQRLAPAADLLPVVSNPNAKIGERSKLKDLGKTPSLYNAQREAVGILKWTQRQSTGREITKWSRDGDLGICLQTRSLRAVDVDIADPAAAQAVIDLVELGLGALPRRGRSNSGKALLLLRMPGSFSKRIVRTEHGIIEFLAEGQQCIVEGTHPSGARYEWSGLDALTEIPEVTPAEFEVLWAELSKLGIATEERRGMVPAVSRNADDMRDPVVAFLAENSHVTGYERDGRVDVKCPWEAEHTSDSGPTSTSWFPAGVGGFQQGHFRCLHAHCAHRTDGDFLEAIGYVRSEFDVVEAEELSPGVEREPLPPFSRTSKGQIEATINNVLLALRRPDVCGMRLGFDNFKSELMCADGIDGGAWRHFTDSDYVRLRATLERGMNGFAPIKPELIKDCTKFIGDENSFDSAIAWANTLQWDGVCRVDSFFTDYYSVPDTEYARAVGRYLWTALAGRCVQPGIKADMVPVLISGQGTAKTTSVEVLAPTPDAFVEVDLNAKDAELARSMRGKLIGELAELRGLQSKGAEGIKAWISRKSEETRRLYAEFYRKQPRRLIFIGTGNKEFLDDETGERRWLPMRVGQVDVDGIAAVRDQLWAEGLHMFRKAGVHWQRAQVLAEGVHAEFKISDEWDGVIADWLARDAMDGRDGELRACGIVQVRDVLVSALRFADKEYKKADEMRVAKVLAKLGFERGTHWLNGKVVKGWRKRCLQDFADLA